MDDLDFDFGDEINDISIQESNENENLYELHKALGMNSETINKLDTLIKIKKNETNIFPSIIFLRILEKIKEDKIDINDKLYNFYCFLEKYADDIKFEDLNQIIELTNEINSDIFSFWEIKLNHEILKSLLNKRKIKLDEFLDNCSFELIEKGYEVKNLLILLIELTKKLKEDHGVEKNKPIIESIITILKTYPMKGDFFEKIENFIKNLNLDSPREIYTIASQKQEKMGDLTLNELIKEIKERNKIYFTDERKNNLSKQMDVISSMYNKYKNFKDKNDIKKWVKKRIPSLKESYNKNENRIEISAEILAVISIANEIFTTTPSKNGYKLRTIQLMDVLLFINKNEDKGLIEEISTGEGKSTIICALATFLGLIGKKVDIITSALNLAKRDVEQLRDFYGYFNLKVDYVEKFNPEPYKADIIYGTFLEFEGDFLDALIRNEQIRGKRKFEVLIVDEIDNLFIDNIGGSTRLVYSTMGYQFLSPIFLNIFFVMKSYESQLSILFNKTLLENGMEEEEKNNIKNLINDEDFRKRNIYPILKNFVCEFLRQLYGMSKNKENNLNNGEQSELEKKFLEQINKKFHLPLNLRPLFENQLENWVDNAYQALFIYQENREYVVSNGIISPVDRENTGEIEQRRVYRDGLHRMLEIKHKLNLGDETLNHTFLSHISFFNFYRNNNQLFFYGMTGTLGDENTLNIFKDKNIFNSEVLFIPTYKAKRFVEFPAILCQDETEQIKVLCEQIEYQVKNKRRILVINNSIKEAIKLRDHLKFLKNINSDQIGLYTRDDDKEQMKNIEKDLQIILSTNLAGRGTDIKTTQTVEENGGLHLILTSMPSNLRIEKQAYGRTSRQGNKGSGQMILLKKEFKTIKEYKNRRNEIEKERLDNMSKIIKETLFKDKLFDQYIRTLNDNKIILHSYLSEDIDERWGIFLDKHIDKKDDLNEENMNNIKLKFNEFFKELNKELKKDDHNLTNSFINIKFGWDKCKDTPLEQMHYNTIAEEKETFAFAAYYYDARALIVTSTPNNYNTNKIKKNLKDAQNILKRILEENVNVCWNLLVENEKDYEGSLIWNQILHRKHFLKNIIKHIQENIDEIIKYEKSEEREEYEIICKEKDLKSLYNYDEAEGENKAQIKEAIIYFENAGLYEVYDIYLKKVYKWYQKLLYLLKLPFEFLLGLVLGSIFSLFNQTLTSVRFIESIFSCFNYYLTIKGGADISDYLLGKNINNIFKKIYYSIGKDIFEQFHELKGVFTNQEKIDKKLAVNITTSNINFIEQSTNLNKIKKFSKDQLSNFIKDEFENIIKSYFNNDNNQKGNYSYKEFIKYLLCFDDYLSNDFWKNEIKNNLIKLYKSNFKEKLKEKEEEILNILIKGYEAKNQLEANNSVYSILKQIISNYLKSFTEFLNQLTILKKYDETKGLNSLEHLIRNINNKEIDDSLAKEIVGILKKNKIIDDNCRFTIKANEKLSLKFLIETNIKNIPVEKEILKLEDFSLYGISRYPIIDDEMNDNIEEYMRKFNQSDDILKNYKLTYLNLQFRNTLYKIIKTFTEDKLVFEYLEELKNFLNEKIISRLNKKIYSKMDKVILGDITSSSIKDAEMKVIENFKKIFLRNEEKDFEKNEKSLEEKDEEEEMREENKVEKEEDEKVKKENEKYLEEDEKKNIENKNEENNKDN